ncbi:MAG: hypothetical protein HY011_08780 [Acidobacteria bacterium]|nr:hypothetical protein [Acidobacteriota bacterium]
MNETPDTMAEHLCPTHLIRLTHLLAGGAGHCSKCGLFVQSLNHPMPTLSPELVAKREAGRIEDEKTKKLRVAQKRKERRQAAKAANQAV